MHIHLHHKDWVDRLSEALWAYRITWRNTIGHTPYELVYGKQVLLPIEFQVKTFVKNPCQPPSLFCWYILSDAYAL